MTGIDYTKLRELAQAATPGPWWQGRYSVGAGGLASDPDAVVLHNAATLPDAEYIAAVSPDVVLALLDEIDTLRGPDSDDRDELITAPIVRALHEMRSQRDALAAVIEKAKSAAADEDNVRLDVAIVLSSADTASVLAERDARIWGEGYAAGQDSVYTSPNEFPTPTPNPYRTKGDE